MRFGAAGIVTSLIMYLLFVELRGESILEEVTTIYSAGTELINCTDHIVQKCLTTTNTLILFEENATNDANIIGKNYRGKIIRTDRNVLELLNRGNLKVPKWNLNRESVGYVMILRRRDTFPAVVRAMKTLHYRPNSKMVVVLTANSNSKDLVQTIFQTAVENDILNIIVTTIAKDHMIREAEASVLIYTFFPFLGIKCTSLERIILIDQYVNGNFVSGNNLFPEKVQNLYGCSFPLITADFPLKVIADVSSNGTLRVVTGVTNNIVNIMAAKLNFTAQFIGGTWQSHGYVLQNGTIYGYMKHLINGDFEGSFVGGPLKSDNIKHLEPFRVGDFTHFVWIVPKPEFYPSWMRVFFPFQPFPWICAFAVYCLVVTCNKLIKRFVHGYANGLMFECPFLYNFSILLGISVSEPPPHIRVMRMVFLIWALGSFIINYSYQASLLGFVTKPSRYPFINTMSELIDSGLSLGGHFAQRLYFKDNKDPVMYRIYEKWQNEHGDWKSVFIRIKMKRDFGFLAIHSIAKHVMYSNSFFESQGKPLLHVVPQIVFSIPNAYNLRRNSPYLSFCTNIVNICVHSGLMLKWERDILHSLILVGRKSMLDYEDTGLHVISVDDLLGAFLILFSGLLLSTVVFLYEMARKYHTKFLVGDLHK